MSNRLVFEILTPQGAIFQVEAKHVKLPGSAGYFGVLPNHIPFMTTLDIGVIELDSVDGKHEKIAISSGFVDVGTDKVVVFVEMAERAEQIDLPKAEQAKKLAEEKLKTVESDIEKERLLTSIAKSKARIKAKSGS